MLVILKCIRNTGRQAGPKEVRGVGEQSEAGERAERDESGEKTLKYRLSGRDPKTIQGSTHASATLIMVSIQPYSI